jgi:hypothetical protein
MNAFLDLRQFALRVAGHQRRPQPFWRGVDLGELREVAQSS